MLSAGNMTQPFPIHNQNGLTLVEIIAVLIILGILVTLAVARYISFEANARMRVFDYGIRELNALEGLTWADQKISASGYISDAKIFNAITYDIGTDYYWDTGDPTPTGGTMFLKGDAYTLSRISSTTSVPAIWRRAP